jgi:excisionase family DNA binding protein
MVAQEDPRARTGAAAVSQQENSGWMPEAPLLLTIEQAAALLNLSPRTIRNLVARKELVRRKVGSRTLIPRSSVDAFIKRDHATKN